jgi:hypothetical protein
MEQAGVEESEEGGGAVKRRIREPQREDDVHRTI